MQDTVTHSTSRGTFSVETVFVAKSRNYRLWFEKDGPKIDLGLYTYLFKLADSIEQGEHDQTLGFKASALKVRRTSRTGMDCDRYL